MHIASIQIGDVFIGVHRKLHERRVFGWAFCPWLHGQSSWLVKLLFFRCTLAGKHISSQTTTQYSASQYGCHAEEPIEGKDPAPYILTGANIQRPLCHCVPHSCGEVAGLFRKTGELLFSTWMMHTAILYLKLLLHSDSQQQQFLTEGDNAPACHFQLPFILELPLQKG